MSDLRPRQIAWQIIASEPDPHKRTKAAQEYPGLVQDHVRIWNESEDIKIAGLFRTMRRLADKARGDPSPTKRAEAKADLKAMRYQCQGWILDRLDQQARDEREAG